MTHSGKTLNASLRMHKELQLVTLRIDHMYQVLDKVQYEWLKAADAEFRKDPAYSALKHDDPSFFHGRSLVYNRQTAQHRDTRDPPTNLTPVLTLGPYTSGTMHLGDVGHDLMYNAGTLVMLRGAMISHGVTYQGGQRVCIAHFMHQTSLADIQRGVPPMTSFNPNYETGRS